MCNAAIFYTFETDQPCPIMSVLTCELMQKEFVLLLVGRPSHVMFVINGCYGRVIAEAQLAGPTSLEI